MSPGVTKDPRKGEARAEGGEEVMAERVDCDGESVQARMEKTAAEAELVKEGVQK